MLQPSKQAITFLEFISLKSVIWSTQPRLLQKLKLFQLLQSHQTKDLFKVVQQWQLKDKDSHLQINPKDTLSLWTQHH